MAQDPADSPPPSGPKPDLDDKDLRDIQNLLSQEPDVTRQDIQAHDFQAMLDRYTQVDPRD